MCTIFSHSEPPPFNAAEHDVKIEPTTSGFNISWNYTDPESDGITKWKVYYKEEGAAEDEWSFVEIDPSDTSALIMPNNTIPGKSYDVKIVPVAGNEENKDGDKIKATLSKYTVVG